MRYGAGQRHHGAAVIDEKTAGEIIALIAIYLVVLAIGVVMTWLEERRRDE